MRQMLFDVLLPNGMVVEPKVARRLQTQIDELKGTNRNTAPTREKILERIEDLEDGQSTNPRPQGGFQDGSR